MFLGGATKKWLPGRVLGLAGALMVVPALGAFAQEPTVADLKVMVDTVWVLFTAFLVFWMNAGFALVESGFCRSKNTVNILAKNFVVFAISAIAYYFIGFGLMFGDGNSFIGLKGFMMLGADNSPATGDAYQGIFSALNWTGVPLEAKFFFQLVFAGTAATIVSGAVAERIKYQAYLLFAFLLVAFVYPVTGHWIWGGGFLSGMGFHDFAGSTQVHSVGGWAALLGILFLGPRLGKYKADGSINAIPGHNMTSAALGGLILWLGWFGFNPGSTMAADPVAISHVAITTALAAAAGTMVSCLYAWVRLGSPDFSMTVNGCLAGLVAVTAPCDGVSALGSLAIGVVAGLLVVEGVLLFDKLHIDDPVGALSVHLLNGVWGTLSFGLFSTTSGLLYGFGPHQFVVQMIGVACTAAAVLVSSAVLWAITKAILGMRVSPDEEYVGLDRSEMGMEAYPQDAVSPAYKAAVQS